MVKCDEEPNTMDAFEEWVILHVLGTTRRTPPVRSKTFGTDASRTTAEQGCQSAVATTQQAADGGATLVIAALRRDMGARPTQEAVRLFRQLMGLRDMSDNLVRTCENGLHILRRSSRKQGTHSIKQLQKSTWQLSYIP